MLSAWIPAFDSYALRISQYKGEKNEKLGKNEHHFTQLIADQVVIQLWSQPIWSTKLAKLHR